MAKPPSPALLTYKQLPQYAGFLVQTLFSPILISFAIMGLACLFIGVSVFYNYEINLNPDVNSLEDALWWGMTTISTVGYGDIVPVTSQGRLAGVLLMLTGLVIFISFSTLLVSVFFAHAEEGLSDEQHSEFDIILKELKEIKNQIEELKSK